MACGCNRRKAKMNKLGAKIGKTVGRYMQVDGRMVKVVPNGNSNKGSDNNSGDDNGNNVTS